MERQVSIELSALLHQVPGIENIQEKTAPARNDAGADAIVDFSLMGKPHSLVCEFKSVGQPRHVRTAILQVRDYAAHHPGTIPLVAAPYLSPESQEMCKAAEVGYLDFQGNVRIVLEGIFIERKVESKPASDRRELKSIFRPKSAQVLRIMLRDPARQWRVTDLAEASGVSVGHVSNVRTALLDREWAEVSPAGLHLSDPIGLLEEWREVYEPPPGRKESFYTALHGDDLEAALLGVLNSDPDKPLAMLASYSAAKWLAPYGRVSTHYFYADERGAAALKRALNLQPSAKGSNVLIHVLDDLGLFFDALKPTSSVVCTSTIQTYLDLSKSGERGQEAADHLKQDMLTWS